MSIKYNKSPGIDGLHSRFLKAILVKLKFVILPSLNTDMRAVKCPTLKDTALYHLFQSEIKQETCQKLETNITPVSYL